MTYSLEVLEQSFWEYTKKNAVNIHPLEIGKIQPKESIRLKCIVPLCEYYGVCKVCPPHIPSVAEFRQALSDFQRAYMVELKETVQDINLYRQDFSAELRLVKVIGDLEQIAFGQGYYQFMGLNVGGCKLCQKCTPLHEPCRHPFKARPSPEGFGIDITTLARDAGITIEWPPEKTVTFLGLVLV